MKFMASLPQPKPEFERWKVLPGGLIPDTPALPAPAAEPKAAP